MAFPEAAPVRDRSYVIGCDIGVTHIKAVAVASEGVILSQRMNDTLATSADWPERVKETIEQLESEHGPAAAFGLASPGLAAPDGRCISWMQGRLSEVQGLDWTQYLGRAAPIVNDAQAALLGEVWQGAAAGATNVFLLTLGTGVGGAAMVDGRLLTGHIGRAGHLGHITLDADGKADIVGTPGSLEDAIGNCTLAQRSAGRFTTTHDLIAAAKAGDAEAKNVWTRSVYRLAAGIASLINVLDPEVVIIGGGIARAGPALFDPLSEFLDQFEWRPHGQRVQIVPAGLGEFAGALGAAWNGIRASSVKNQ